MTRNNHPLTSPRRLITAGLLALVFAGGSFGILGLASAGGASAVPDSLQISALAPGDAGVYNRTYASLEDGAWKETSYNSWFNWTPEQAIRLGDGTWVAVHGRVTEGASGTVTTNGVEHKYQIPSTAWYETATGRVVAQNGLYGVGGSASGSLLQEQLGDSFTVRTTWNPTQPCGLPDLLRAGPVDLTQPIHVTGSCSGVGKNATFTAVGVDTIQGVEAVRFDANKGDSHLSYWFSAGFPEALRIESTSPSYRSSADLVRFHRGAGPWDTHIRLPAATPLPAIKMAPRELWGPNDAGVTHPFPLSAAFAQARADKATGLDDFLAAHPAAYTASAEYEEEVNEWFVGPADQSDIQRSWTLLVTDGAAGQHVKAMQEVRRVVVNGVPRESPPIASNEGTDSTISGYPALSALSPQLPTVASIMARRAAFLGTPAASANAWAVDLHTVSVGRAQLQTGCPPIPPGSCKSVSVSNMPFLGVDDTGRPAFLENVTTTTTTTTGLGAAGSAPAAQSGSGPSGGSGASPGVALGAWSAPQGPVATGAGILSALVGLLYWAWPAVKGGAVGLFSRVEHDALLNHPVRSRIHQLVESQPGIHYQELVRQSGAGKGAVEHHLRKLTDGGLIVARRGAGFTCYFARGADRSLMAGAPALKSDGARRILAYIQAHPGTASQAIAQQTGLDPATVSHHVQRLAEGGLVEVRRDGRSLALTAMPQASRALAVGAAA